MESTTWGAIVIVPRCLSSTFLVSAVHLCTSILIPSSGASRCAAISSCVTLPGESSEADSPERNSGFEWSERSDPAGDASASVGSSGGECAAGDSDGDESM
ncbi:hypothetical protein IWZ03DRAFT_386126 [Phyllosticta citriasiana]|uniref:Secreted protein n=1 Tax=Phyllosticta citriasiana TaxID=595635 RepID=A0ABR1KDN7_9PEZI